jgi:uncharacterized protein YjbJ (UPF0337 family)
MEIRSLGEGRPKFLSFLWLDSTEAERPSGDQASYFPLTLSGRVARRIQPTSKRIRRNRMGQSTKDEIKGACTRLKVPFKGRAGQVTNVPNVAAKGKSEKLAGRAQKEADSMLRLIIVLVLVLGGGGGFYGHR